MVATFFYGEKIIARRRHCGSNAYRQSAVFKARWRMCSGWNMGANRHRSLMRSTGLDASRLMKSSSSQVLSATAWSEPASKSAIQCRLRSAPAVDAEQTVWLRPQGVAQCIKAIRWATRDHHCRRHGSMSLAPSMLKCAPACAWVSPDEGQLLKMACYDAFNDYHDGNHR